MRIALATCSNLPDWEVDDAPLVDALEARAVEVLRPAWDATDFDWASCAACLIRTTWDYMERRDEFVRWAERVGRVTRLFNPAHVVHWNTDKRYLAELEDEGVPCIPTVWLERGSRAVLTPEALGEDWQRAFLKPTVGASASDTLRFDRDAAGLAAAQELLDARLATHGFLLQPYLATVESEGELSALWLGGEFTHWVRKVPVPGDYRVQDDYGATDGPYAPSEEERARAARIVELASRRLDEPELLYARVDFLRDADGQLLLNELELVEPSLFLRHGPDAANALADGLLARL